VVEDARRQFRARAAGATQPPSPFRLRRSSRTPMKSSVHESSVHESSVHQSLADESSAQRKAACQLRTRRFMNCCSRPRERHWRGSPTTAQGAVRRQCSARSRRRRPGLGPLSHLILVNPDIGACGNPHRGRPFRSTCRRNSRRRCLLSQQDREEAGSRRRRIGSRISRRARSQPSRTTEQFQRPVRVVRQAGDTLPDREVIRQAAAHDIMQWRQKTGSAEKRP